MGAVVSEVVLLLAAVMATYSVCTSVHAEQRMDNAERTRQRLETYEVSLRDVRAQLSVSEFRRRTAESRCAALEQRLQGSVDTAPTRRSGSGAEGSGYQATLSEEGMRVSFLSSTVKVSGCPCKSSPTGPGSPATTATYVSDAGSTLGKYTVPGPLFVTLSLMPLSTGSASRDQETSGILLAFFSALAERWSALHAKKADTAEMAMAATPVQSTSSSSVGAGDGEDGVLRSPSGSGASEPTEEAHPAPGQAFKESCAMPGVCFCGRCWREWGRSR